MAGLVIPLHPLSEMQACELLCMHQRADFRRGQPACQPYVR